MKYVIIGNSSAAINCVEAIRETDKENSITLISDEEYMTYSRPVISYLLAGKVTEKKMWYRNENFYKDNSVDTLLGKKVSSIDTKGNTVVMEDNTKIPFDKLLIATGGTPFVPPIKGLEGDMVFTFTKWSDADRLLSVAKDIKNVVVIGAGMIGTKATEALAELGKSVTLVELGDSVLGRALDAEASQIIKNRMEQKGVNVILSNEVTEIGHKDKILTSAILRDGTVIECDAVVVAIGVVPNISIVKNTKIKLNRGIVVNGKMETNVKGVYAAGDVVEAEDIIVEGKRSIPVWPLAARQGTVAGRNMSDAKKDYAPGFPMNAIEFCGVSTISMGLTDVTGDEFEIIKESDVENGIYKKIVLKNNRVVGAIFVGSVEKAGIINTLIKEKFDVSEIKEKLLSDNFGYISFSREFRRERLETVSQ